MELHEISLLGFALAIGVVMLIALLRRKPRLALAVAPPRCSWQLG